MTGKVGFVEPATPTGTLDGASHSAIGEPSPPYIAVPIDGEKDRAVIAAGLVAPGLEGAHGA